MRRWLTLAVGALIGQTLAFSGIESPDHVYRQATGAVERHDYAEAVRLWSRAVSLQPDNALFHYRLASALEHLGQLRSAADAYQLALLLAPPEPLARQVRKALSELAEPARSGNEQETTVAVAPARGVWVVSVTLNGIRPARFLVDTGASVTLLSPALAAAMVTRHATETPAIELQTVAGPTTAAAATLGSLRIGDLEAHKVPVVIHDPGPDLDGILGNAFLSGFVMTLDADRRLLHLRRPAPLADAPELASAAGM